MKLPFRTILKVLTGIAIITFISSAYYFKLKWSGFGSKSLWDWMDLLIVPLVLAIVGFLYNRSEKSTEREITKDNQKEAMLQSYLSAMTELILKYDLNDPKVISIAQARTVSLITRLDNDRKVTVLSFLAASELISVNNPIIKLSGLDFSENTLGSFLSVWLVEVNLSGCKLSGSTFWGSNFRYADLINADLSGADLSGADFCGANLKNSNFFGTLLSGTNFSEGKFVLARNSTEEIERKVSEEWLDTLNKVNFTNAQYDNSTKWPDKFNPVSAGAIYRSDWDYHPPFPA